MKKIEAIVRQERIGAVRKALVETGHRSMINHDVWYRGTENEISQHQADGITPMYDFMSKVKIELIVNDESVQDVIDAISDSAHTGHVGDGKIFVMPVEEAIRIQTKETGDIVI
ncbi:MAG: P-II family nitrogen regulator [Methanoregula sp.]|jgi:nitrogen regulatory protein P-II 1